MHFYVMENFCNLFTLRPSDLNTTLTYFLMDNFCPCLFIIYLVFPTLITSTTIAISFLFIFINIYLFSIIIYTFDLSLSIYLLYIIFEVIKLTNFISKDHVQ